ncbi:zinc-dependent alcohol dehydrogenase family protein [Chitinophaga sp. HK235]|uniref:zinc-dependent alcohol dehydrogenase family protein n=1 Tax=Chitinophaga sp. HK235 TaxID=2952571 RepID=UPI001BADD641|nr:zinc-dependent alcohol dehydrogenase family protein [Chitinophaga sp. HK235]
MKTIVIKRYGQAKDVFETIETPMPVLSSGEILVNVMATSVNPIDYKIRGGYLPHLITAFPAVLHGDVAGVVAQVGPDEKRFKVGDRVYGCIGGFLDRSGALGEFVKGDSTLFARMPQNLDFAQAAALPLVGITAYQTVFEKGNIQPGQRVLIYGAAGGVGHIAVQLASIAGAEVFATVSSQEKADIVQALGADHTIDYTRTSIEDMIAQHTNGEGFDMVIDMVGNDNLLNSFTLAKVRGTIVTILALTTLDISILHQKALSFHAVHMITPFLFNDTTGQQQLGSTLDHITALVEAGQVKPYIDRIFPFSQIAAAHEYAESGRTTGKVVIAHEGGL